MRPIYEPRQFRTKERDRERKKASGRNALFQLKPEKKALKKLRAKTISDN